MVFTRLLCIAALATQSLALYWYELKELLEKLTPSVSEDLAAYLVKHNAEFAPIPSDQALACLGGVLYGTERFLSGFPPETLTTAQASRHTQDAIRHMDFALANEHSCPDDQNVRTWIAKFTIESVCRRVGYHDLTRQKVSACLPYSYLSPFSSDDDEEVSSDQ